MLCFATKVILKKNNLWELNSTESEAIPPTYL